MTLDGEPNTRICVVKCKQGMVLEEQKGKGVIKA